MTPEQLDTIFKAYDIRGTVPDQLDATIVRAIGPAFARLAAAPRVLIAPDMRESGPELAAAFSEGVRREGVDAVLLGLASTDMIYFAAGKLDAPGAMLTASHNPAAYNGIKLCLSGARPVGVESGLDEIKQTTAALLRDGDTRPARGTESTVDLLDEFVAHVHSFIDVSALRPMKVVADTANGMGGLIVPRVFDKLPIELDVLFPELDGTFPNHPADPIQPANQTDLRKRVASSAPTSAWRSTAMRTAVPRRRAEPRAVGLDHHRAARGGHPREAPWGEDHLQPDLLEGRARGDP
jgi:phosphomannomutase